MKEHLFNIVIKQLFKAFVLLLIYINPNISFGINKNTDEKADQLLFSLEENWDNKNYDSLLFYINKLKQYSQEQKLLHYTAYSNYYRGRYLQLQGKFDSSTFYLSQVKNQLSNSYDTLFAGKTDFTIAVNYTYLNQVNSSLVFYHKAEKQISQTNDSAWNSLINNYLGITYFEIGNYPWALKYNLKALNFLSSSKNYINIGNIYNTLGNIYRKMKETQKEKHAYLKAIKILNNIPTNLAIAMAYNNISEIYINEGKIDTGFRYLEKAKDSYLAINYPLGLCSYYAVKSHYYFYQEPPLLDSVIKLSNRSIKIALEHQDIRQYADASFYLGRAYIRNGKYINAESVLLKAFKKAQDFQYKNEESNLAHSLSDVYEKMNKYQSANHYLKIHQRLKDSLYNEEKVRHFTSLDLQNQFKQKQLNDSLKNQLEKTKLKLEYDGKINQLQLEKEKDWYLKWLLFAIFIISILSVIILYLNSNRKRTKKEKELQFAQEKIKLKNQEISYHLLSQTRFSHQLEELKNDLGVFTNKFRAKKDREQYENILYLLNRQKPNPLDEFEEIFKAIYPEFFINLHKNYPDLTSRELQICALVKLNFSTKDIASITNLAVSTLETSRYRIRKKLKIQSNEQLYTFLLKL